jgi:predicted NBD/HSP70 family sugar kinase
MNENNKYLILRTISMHGPCSRAWLCEYTRLSKMTITNIVSEYLRQGVVEESGKAVTVVGRKADLLRIVPDSLLSLGIFVNRGYTEIGVVNLNGSILRSERFEVSPSESVDDFLDILLYLSSKYMTGEWKGRIWGIGISAAGPLDAERGVILEPPGFHGLKNIPIVDVLYKAFGIPAYLELGVHVAALSELYYGNKEGYENFLYMSVSNWIGGCVVSDKKVYQGASGLAGLMGGVVVERDAMDENIPMSGCLQDYASLLALVHWAREKGSDPDITWNNIVTRARRGDIFACKIIDRLIRYLEIALINAVAFLDIQCVYISGSVLLGEDLILGRLDASINRLIFAPSTRRVAVLAAKYANDAEIIGITALVTERHFEREMALSARRDGY